MWGNKAKRIKDLEQRHALDGAIVADLRVALAEESACGQVLLDRCASLAADLKAAQNALLAEVGQNDIRSEAIAHVREVIREAGEAQ